jgi:hypothetical protein
MAAFQVLDDWNAAAQDAATDVDQVMLRFKASLS